MGGASYEQSRQEAAQLLARGAELARKAGRTDLAEHLAGAREHLEHQVLYVMVCGEFKRGKSQLINALLEDPHLVPVDVDIATNIVSILSYGKQERIVAHLDGSGGGSGNGQGETTRGISRAEVVDYATETGNPGNRAGVRMVTMEIPNPKLRAGLALIDTPGVGGLNEAHNAVTYSFIPNADAVLFVGDVIQPLTSKELEFAQLVTDRSDSVIFVLTKSDLVNDADTMVDNTRRKLADVLQRPGEAISIVPVSSRLKLDWLDSGDDVDLEDSNFGELERLLWDGLAARRADVLLARALNALADGLRALALPLRAELAVYRGRSTEETSETVKSLEEAERRLRELTEQRARWRVDLSRGLEDIRTELQDEVDARILDLKSTVEHTYLADPRMVEKPEEIAKQVNAAIALLVGDLTKQLDERAAALVTDVRAATGLHLRDYQGAELVNSVGTPDTDRIGTIIPKRTGKTFELARGATYGQAPGMLVGGIVGGALGTLLIPMGIGPREGFAVGSVLGGIVGRGVIGPLFGARKQIAQIKERDLAQTKAMLQREINQIITEVQQKLRVGLRNSLRQFERRTQDEFNDQLNAELQTAAASREALKQALQRSQKQVRRRRVEAESTLAPIEQVLSEANGLAERVLGGVRSTGKAPTLGTEQVELDG